MHTSIAGIAVAILFAGHPRGALEESWVLDTTVDHLLQPFRKHYEIVDVFVATPHVDEGAIHHGGLAQELLISNIDRSKFFRSRAVTPEDLDRLAGKLGAVASIMSNNANSTSLHIPEGVCALSSNQFKHTEGQLQMFARIAAAYGLARSYELIRSRPYDYFVRARLDMVWFSDAPLIDPTIGSQMNAPCIDTLGYVSKSDADAFFSVLQSWCPLASHGEGESNEDLLRRHFKSKNRSISLEDFPVSFIRVGPSGTIFNTCYLFPSERERCACQSRFKELEVKKMGRIPDSNMCLTLRDGTALF